MKKRFIIVFVIFLLMLSSCNQYRYSDGKKSALKTLIFFKELVVLCIDNQLKQPVFLGEINQEEYDKLDNIGKKILKKCVDLNIIEVIYTDYHDKQQKFNYIMINFDTALSYQGVIYVPNEFSIKDVENLIYQTSSEPVQDLTVLDNNLYYYYTNDANDEDYSDNYIFPDGKVEK